jgi:uncharacterized protein
MSEDISLLISRELNIPVHQVQNTVNLLKDDATIPFISRYRKEATGGLDELSIQSIDARLKYYDELQKRKATIIKSIESQDKLTPELSNRIMDCWDATTLEDIYLPYKPKRHTRAEVARSHGLEPLAKIIMSQHSDNIASRAEKFVNGDTVPRCQRRHRRSQRHYSRMGIGKRSSAQLGETLVPLQRHSQVKFCCRQRN